MKKEELILKIKTLGKETFTNRELKILFPQEAAYLNTYSKRLIKAGVIEPLARGLYTLKGQPGEMEKVATTYYYPSYISFESALAKYGVINQGPYGLTLATSRHAKKIKLGNLTCEYRQLKRSLFFGFKLIGGIYLAEPEKALLDTLYFIGLGRRQTSPREWSLSSLDRDRVRQYAKSFGKKVQKTAEELLIKDG